MEQHKWADIGEHLRHVEEADKQRRSAGKKVSKHRAGRARAFHDRALSTKARKKKKAKRKTARRSRKR